MKRRVIIAVVALALLAAGYYFLPSAPAPQPAPDQWLREDNAFGLTKVTRAAPFNGFVRLPSWFPPHDELTRCEIHQAPGQRMTLVFDPAKKVLYATDAGHGFAVARAD